MLLWLWTGSMVLRTKRHLLAAITLWTVSIALDGAGAMLQLAGLHVFVAPPEGGRMTGFTDHPNDLGAACGIALVPAMMIGTLAVSARNALVGFLGWIPAAFIVTGLILAGSVAAMGAALGALLLWFSSPGVRTASRVAVVSLFVIGLLIVGASGSKVAGPAKRLTLVTNSSSTNAEAGSGEERVKILRIVWPKIKESPLVGVGLDPASATVQIISGAGYATPYLTHGSPLAAWYEAGIFGLIGLLLVFAGLLGAAWRAMAGETRLDDHLVGWSLCGAAVGFAIYQLSAPLVFQQYGWLAAVLLVAWSLRRDAAAPLAVDGEPTGPTAVATRGPLVGATR
jgi:O-antigen ligase